MPRTNTKYITLPPPKNSKPIFISHNSADAAIVDLFTKLLITSEIASRDDIVCTSIEGMGIPDGKELKPYLKEAIREQRLFIAIATDTYFQRPICMAELGAVWFADGDVFPLIVPPQTHDDMQGILKPGRSTTKTFSIP